MIYLIGSLRNPRIPTIANQLRAAGHDVFDDWFAAGADADDAWQRYEQGRGHTYTEALSGIAALHVFDHDRKYLNNASLGVLVAPAGKSAHLELGYLIGRRVPAFILMESEPERYDVMLKLATGVCVGVEELIERLDGYERD